MSIVDRLPEIVYPLTQVNKVNEIVDVLNTNLNMYYSATNPVLTPSQGVATWTVTHNLGTENVNCSLYNGDNLVIAKISIVSENSISVSFNASASIEANTYKIVIISNGANASSGGGGGGSYTLPVATTSTLGGVKIDGTSITINSNGVISSSGGGGSYTLPVATTSTLGGVKIDGTSIAINDGVISTVASQASYTTTNTSILIPSSGTCSWTVTHNLNSTDILCSLFVNNVEVFKNTTINSANSCTVSFNATENIEVGNATIIIISAGVVPEQVVVVDTALSSTSTNPVQNKVINAALSSYVTKTSNRWVSKFQNFYDNATLNNTNSGSYTSYKVDLSSYLPDANSQFEVLVKIFGTAGNATIRSGGFKSSTGIWGNSGSIVLTSNIFPIFPTDQAIYFEVWSNCTNVVCEAVGYKRLG